MPYRAGITYLLLWNLGRFTVVDNVAAWYKVVNQKEALPGLAIVRIRMAVRVRPNRSVPNWGFPVSRTRTRTLWRWLNEAGEMKSVT